MAQKKKRGKLVDAIIKRPCCQVYIPTESLMRRGSVVFPHGRGCRRG